MRGIGRTFKLWFELCEGGGRNHSVSALVLFCRFFFNVTRDLGLLYATKLVIAPTANTVDYGRVILLVTGATRILPYVRLIMTSRIYMRFLYAPFIGGLESRVGAKFGNGRGT